MIFAFEDLEVWHKAVDFAVEVIETEIAAMIKGLINSISKKSPAPS